MVDAEAGKQWLDTALDGFWACTPERMVDPMDAVGTQHALCVLLRLQLDADVADHSSSKSLACGDLDAANALLL